MQNFVIFLAVLVEFSAQFCYRDDVEIKGRCFNFNTRTTGWKNASILCQSWGYNLASIHSEEENNLISEAAKKFFTVSSHNFYWIGLHYASDGFEWEDGSPVDYYNWAEGSPNSNEYVMIRTDRDQWQTTGGLWQKTFVCTYYPYGYTTEKISCDLYDIIINNRCYSFNQAMLSYEDASNECQKYGKTLAIFDNLTQIKTISSYAQTKFQSTFGSFWIGLQRDNSSTPFLWENGESTSFTNWYSGYPYCGQLVAGQDISNTKWRTFSEDTQLFSVCSGVVS
ncbi:unnamed protein product [Caenorhabditis angaria]|uniref:C-type lectin domain-containing protein n=1 Tax=Caenorhabditis angaria TaxID=860376 RepID=A0A9P1IKI4_9PELO|nr:unnamed protein product [Caenorhabditis angaria]